MIVGDDAEPTGAIAVRLDDAEAAAVLDALDRAVRAVCREQSNADFHALFGDRPDGAQEADAILAAARKIGSLLAPDVRGGLEIRARRSPILESPEP